MLEVERLSRPEASHEPAYYDFRSFIVRMAKQHDADAFHRLRSITGVGKILALTILYEVHDIGRFETVQQFASYARLVKCAKESAGKRMGTGGAKIGIVYLRALSILAHKLGRVAYFVITRSRNFDEEKFLAA